MKTFFLATLALLLALAAPAPAATGAEMQRRVAAEAAGGSIVAHVTVVLSDGPKAPEANPWWGGQHGLLTVFAKQGGWKIAAKGKGTKPGVVERVVLTKKLSREGREVAAYLIADAWEESAVLKALTSFFAHARGAEGETVAVEGAKGGGVRAGGEATLTAYLGRNGMEDVEPVDEETYNITPEEDWLRRAAARPDEAFGIRPRADSGKPTAAASLTSDSKAYFLDKLKRQGAYPLLLTVNPHQPESHALEAALTALVAGRNSVETRSLAAEAYARGMDGSKEAAREKFWSGE